MTRRDLPHLHPAEPPWQETTAHALIGNASLLSRPGPLHTGPFSLANWSGRPTIRCPRGAHHQLRRHISHGADPKSP